MSIETLIKKYEEELPKRWTREGHRILESDFDNVYLQSSRLLMQKEAQRIRDRVQVDSVTEWWTCEVCGWLRNEFGYCECHRKALAEVGHYPKEWL